MSDFTISEAQQKRLNILQSSYIESDKLVSWSEVNMMKWIFYYDLVCRKFGSSTTQPFSTEFNSQSSRQSVKFTQTGYAMNILLSWQAHAILNYFSPYRLNPHIELITSKLLHLQQTQNYYVQNTQLLKQCLNEIRVSVHSRSFIIDDREWNLEGREALAAQKKLIKKAIKKFNKVSVIALEINQTGLHPKGYLYDTTDLKEVEVQRNAGLKKFTKVLEQAVFKDSLASVLCTAGFDPQRGLYNKLLLVIANKEHSSETEITLQQLNKAWLKSNLSNPFTLQGACLLSQVFPDISFGTIADGDVIRQKELTAYLNMRHQPETYRRYVSKVFKASGQIHCGSIMNADD